MRDSRAAPRGGIHVADGKPVTIENLTQFRNFTAAPTPSSPTSFPWRDSKQGSRITPPEAGVGRESL